MQKAVHLVTRCLLRWIRYLARAMAWLGTMLRLQECHWRMAQ